MKMRSLFIGVAVLVSAALILSGCETETKTEYVTNTVTDEGFRPPADTVWADSIAALEVLLADESDVYSDNIGYTPDVSAELPALTVPSGKTLYLSSYYTGLGGDLTVTGKLVVYGGILTASDKLKGAGAVDVEKGGYLSVSTAAGVFTGDDKLTVTVKKGARLVNASTTALASATDITAWVGYAGDGSLSITTAITGIATLKAAIDAIGDLPDGKGVALTVTPSTATTETSLTVPAGVSLTTSATLATLTSLTVNGTLTSSSATLAKVGTLTVNGTLDTTAATFDSTNGVTIVLGGKAQVEKLGAIAKLAASVTVPTGALFNISAGITDFNSNTVTFTRGNSYVISDVDIVLSKYTAAGGFELDDDIALTAGQSIILSQGKYTVKAGKKIENAGTIILGADASLLLTGAAGEDGAKLTGAGKLVANKTEITGLWQAVGTGAITITAAEGGTASTIAGSESLVVLTAGEGGVISQDSGPGNNLTIAGSTTVALGEVGSIILATASANSGKITLDGEKAILTGTVATADVPTDAGSLAITDVDIGEGIIGSASATKTFGSLAGSLSTADPTLVGTISATAGTATINAATVIDHTP
jgi:hypothetical protein